MEKLLQQEKVLDIGARSSSRAKQTGGIVLHVPGETGRRIPAGNSPACVFLRHVSGQANFKNYYNLLKRMNIACRSAHWWMIQDWTETLVCHLV